MTVSHVDGEHRRGLPWAATGVGETVGSCGRHRPERRGDRNAEWASEGVDRMKRCPISNANCHSVLATVWSP
jgi:hypothetical protein